MANEVEIWNKVMKTAMAMPGVKVDRVKFLTKELMPVCSVDTLKSSVVNRPTDYISLDTIGKLADGCITNHTIKVTSLSALAGLPGGWWTAATIPVDVAQYYFHVFVLAQKLAYLYGYPDLLSEDGELSEEAQGVLTIFVGVMMGASMANKAVEQLSKALADQMVKRIPRYALTKMSIWPIIKQICKWIGVKLTKESFAKGAAKIVPILGSILSGSLTYFSFKPQAKRLKKTLHNNVIVTVK